MAVGHFRTPPSDADAEADFDSDSAYSAGRQHFQNQKQHP